MSIDNATPDEWNKNRKGYSQAATGKLFHPSDYVIKEPGMATPSLETPIVAHRVPDIDPVDKPDHYNVGAIEAIEAIKASMPAGEFRGYLKGNLMKYVWRYDYKGKPVEDLRKARWYLERLIKEIV